MLQVNPSIAPGMQLHTSNRMELLADNLAGIVAQPLCSPLDPEIIVVPNRGMARWLSMQLADRLGVWGNAKFLFPDHFAHDLFRRAFPESPEHTVVDKDLLSWKVLSVLSGGLINDPRLEPLALYLSDGRPVRKFQLAGKIAEAFDQYTVFRPDVILGWEEGREESRDSDWQAVLWRAVTEGRKLPHRARLHRDFLSAIGNLHGDSLPSRIAVFGLSSLPPFHTALLAAAATLTPVHLFVLNPCIEFWDQIVSESEAARIARRELPESGSAAMLHLEGGNRLLASLGGYGREFLSLLHDYDPAETETPSDTPPETLLEHLQADMLHLYDRGSPSGTPAMAIPATDRSVEIHSCHTPLREVEVLYDYLLDVFDSGDASNPSDILVMTPDIATYAPAIRAVFGAPETPGSRIPYSLADLTTGSEGAVVAAFMELLSIPLSRFEATAVLSPLETPAIRAAFGLEETDLETLRTWVRRCGIRWGRGRDGLRELDLPALPDNTWEEGIRRLLLGYALPAGDHCTFSGIAGFDGIEGTSAALAGNLLDYLDGLTAFTRESRTARSPAAWAVLLRNLLTSFFTPEPGCEDETDAIRDAIDGLSKPDASGIPVGAIDFETVRHYCTMRLSSIGSAAPFLSGGVTFCAMMPMRSIPFRIICCIGMNDGAFPRQNYRPSWDLMARHPRRGDRSPDREDRYLFLEALLSARRRLYISYLGRSARDNAASGPSVVVEELLAAIGRGFYPEGADAASGEGAGRAMVFVEHPLQPWNSRCFDGNDRLRTFSHANAAAAGPSGEAASLPRSFFTGELPRRPEAEVDLRQFIDFFRNPVKFLFIRRLGLKLPDREERIEDTESFRLAGLDRYAIAAGLTGQMLKNGDREAAYSLLKAKGALPQGNVGRFDFDSLADEVLSFVEGAVRPLIGKATLLPPLAVKASCPPLTLAGFIDNCYPSFRFACRFADLKAHDYLAAWIPHLLLCATVQPGYPTATVLAAKNRTIRLSAVSDAGGELAKLALLFDAGMHAPLQFFPDATLAYAECILKKNRSPGEAVAVARERYFGSDFSRGEADDPYNALCFRLGPSFDAAWEQCALDVWTPILNASSEQDRAHGHA